MDETLNIKCPDCGASFSFDASIGKLKCEYCGCEIFTEEAKIFSAATGKGADNLEENQNRHWDFEKSSFKSYVCSSCGAELVADAVATVMRCPFCGDHAIAAARISGSMKPDYIIPFSVTKEQVIEEYKKYYSGKTDNIFNSIICDHSCPVACYLLYM
ncbi:MAG: carboxymuconolactone decarboxylase family protein [Lachnospiraceae bacterium]|nr:carboxymuconolactone decarboxylase family protein [Lachnospiraceae bacterium]